MLHQKKIFFLSILCLWSHLSNSYADSLLGISVKGYRVQGSGGSALGVTPVISLFPESLFGLQLLAQNHKFRSDDLVFDSSLIALGVRYRLSESLFFSSSAAMKYIKLTQEDGEDYARASLSSMGLLSQFSSQFVSQSGLLFGVDWLSVYVPLSIKMGTYAYQGSKVADEDRESVSRLLKSAVYSSQFAVLLPQIGLCF